LDPLATGLLILAVNNGTKKLELLLGSDKCYTFTIKLGETTSTYDSQSEIESRSENWVNVKEEDIQNEIKKNFTGLISQTVPIFSALKVKGQKLCDLARKDKDAKVDLPVREINIYSLKMDKFEGQFIDFTVVCSKGTYVRSIAHDLGQNLGVGAHVTKLQREKISNFSIEDSFKLSDIDQILKNESKGINNEILNIENNQNVLKEEKEQSNN
jgi:tRNA pseudouridine55 synthase